MNYAKLKKQNKKMKQKIEKLKEDRDVLEDTTDIMFKTSQIVMTRQHSTIVSLQKKLNEQTAERNALKNIFKEEIIENYEKEKAQ